MSSNMHTRNHTYYTPPRKNVNPGEEHPSTSVVVGDIKKGGRTNRK